LDLGILVANKGKGELQKAECACVCSHGVKWDVFGVCIYLTTEGLWTHKSTIALKGLGLITW